LRIPLVLVSLVTLGAKLPDPPPSVAHVDVTRAAGTHHVVLSEVRSWKNKALDPNVDAHRLQPSTELQPALVSGAGTVVWFVGHDLGHLQQPGDTFRTWSLLLQVDGEEARALWYEDHKEIPRTFATGSGTVTADGHPQVVTVTLALTDAEYADPVTVKALIHRP